MKTYRVTWEIDIDADSPASAARQARDIQLDEENTATVFSVKEYDSEDDAVDVDLLDEED